MFLTAIAANPLAVQFAATEISISWGLWALAAVVPGAVAWPSSPCSSPGCAAGRAPDRGRPGAGERTLAALGPMKRNEWLMAGI